MTLLSFLLPVVMFFSGNPAPQNTQAVEQTGTWKITYFYKNDMDLTKRFNDFTFEFRGGLKFAALKNGTEVEVGTWKKEKDDGKDEIDIEFKTTPLLKAISDDWDIATMTADKIELEDVDAKSISKDVLRFEKVK